MNLNKSGSSAPLIAQDFDTLNRVINDLQAQLKAAQAAIDALQPTTQTPVINSANKVTTAGGISVGDGISGDGTPEKPLTNTGIFSGVTLAASSALTGAGTVASPLAVNPDGTTISINGSNQLTVSLDYALLRVTLAPAFVNTSSSPITLVTGVADKTIVPVAWFIANKLTTITSGGGYSGGFTLSIFHNCSGGVQPVAGYASYAPITPLGAASSIFRQSMGTIPTGVVAQDKSTIAVSLILKANADATLVAGAGGVIPIETNQVVLFYTLVPNLSY